MAKGLSDKQRKWLSAYLGEARLNATKAAEIAGYSIPKQSGAENLSNPIVTAELDRWRDEVKSSGVASLEYRLNRLDEMEQLYWQVIEDRRIAYADDPRVIGGKTGFIVKQYKMVGGGENAMLVEEYVADVGITKEIRSIFDDVAKELGQRVDKVNVSGSLRREYVLVNADDGPVESAA